MRFGTLDGRFVLAKGGRTLDVEQASGGALPSDVNAALGRWADVRSWSEQALWDVAVDVGVDKLGPPVPSPRQVFAVALNYRPHAAEAGFTPPETPLLFTKFPSCITGPVADIRLPDGHVDWEVEVVAVIGRGGRDISRERAWDAVAGLTVGQDLSERMSQLAGTPPQFSLAKSFAGFGPIGPVVVTPEEFPDRDDLAFDCHLDGELMQSARTSEMIFPIDDLVARLSAVCELYPGDLIFSGTPAGVGNRQTPPRFLQVGDTLVSHVEHIGEIRQRFTR